MKRLLQFSILLLLISCTQSLNQKVILITPLADSEDAMEMPHQFQVRANQFKINPRRDTILRLTDQGTVLHIPKNCFQSKSGEIIKSEVIINFKEYSNQAEIAFSGIPMNYTLGGEELCFNSSGMFDISGTADNAPIEVVKDKSMEIDYHLAKKNADIDFYKLDDDCSKWQLINKINPKNDNTNDSPSIPVKPIKKDLNDERIIQIDFASTDIFQEFQQYNGVSFRVNEKTEFDVKDTEGVWFSFDLKETITDGEYKLDFTGLDVNQNWIEKTYYVNPVYEEGDYQKALKEYKRKYAMIAATKEKNRQKENIRIKKLQIEQEQWLKDQEVYNLEREKRREKRMALAKLEAKTNPNSSFVYKTPGQTFPDIIRGLELTSFGIYNCDQIYRMQNKVTLNGLYVDQKNNKINDGLMLSMIDMDYNGAFSFDPEKFTCDSKANNVLLLFTTSGKLYILDKGKFRNMAIKEEGAVTFQMREVTSQIKNTSDLSTYLGV